MFYEEPDPIKREQRNELKEPLGSRRKRGPGGARRAIRIDRNRGSRDI